MYNVVQVWIKRQI